MGLTKQEAEEEAFNRSGLSEWEKKHVKDAYETRKNPNFGTALYRTDPDGPRDTFEFLPGCGCSMCYWHSHHIRRLMDPPSYGLPESYAEKRA